MTPPGQPGRQSAANSGQAAWLLGVDGGGTKTQAWLARRAQAEDEDYVVVGCGEAGSSNLRAVGAAAALANLAAAISAAWEASAVEPHRVESAVFALAGAGQPDVRDQFTSWADDCQLASRLRIVHDGEAALAAAAPDGWGVAVIAGTGSVALGVDRQGQQAVAGGWGYWFGDEGSAFWLAQAALRAVSQAADGRGPATSLTAAFLQRLQVDDPRAMLAALAAEGEVRHALAQLADVVTALAEQGDGVARKIVGQAADDLASLALCVADALVLGEQFPLALAGGALCGSKLLRTRLLNTLGEQGRRPTPVKLVPEPVAGCLKIAYHDLHRADATVD